MSIPPPSRNAPPRQRTLQDVLDGVASDVSLTERRRQDLCSALRQVARVLGQPLNELPAHPGYLRQRLATVSPAAASMSTRRWINVVSLLRSGLKQAGLSTVPGRYLVAMTPAWDRLWQSINDRATRNALSRLARYCSSQGIAPDDVDDAVMERFRAAITDEGIVRNPREVHRVACNAWNRVRQSREMELDVTVPSYRTSYTLAWPVFPVSLKQEVDRYLERLAGTDLLDELDFRPLRASSIAMRERQLRQFVSALAHRGHDPQSLRGLADLVGIDTFKDGLRFLLERAGNQKSRSVHNLACALTAMARYQVKVDAEHRDRLRGICRQLDPGDRGLTEKNRKLLRQFDDERNVAALLLLPDRLIAEARRNKQPTRADALLVQIALAIEFELMTLMRIGNLVNLDRERHLEYTRTGGRGVLHLVIPGSEVKNGVPVEVTLPAPTVAIIELYNKTYRPLLLSRPSPFLFPGKDGRPKGRSLFGKQISKAIRERTGLLVNPHGFRHIMTKIGLTAEPGNYGMMRLANGHKTSATTERYYAGTEGPLAVRRFDEHVLRLRERLAPTGRRRRRK